MKRTLLFDPGNHPATWDDIKASRDAHEQSPLLINGHRYDADEISIKRMELALGAFESLPTLVSGQLAWKLADNSVVMLTKVQLQDVYDQVKVKLAQRAAVLHTTAVGLASNPPVRKLLQLPSTWGVDGF